MTAPLARIFRNNKSALDKPAFVESAMYSLLDLEPPEIIDPVAKEVLRPGDFMFTFDLKSGYHHVDIFLEHRKLKAFPWKFSDGSVRQNTDYTVTALYSRARTTRGGGICTDPKGMVFGFFRSEIRVYTLTILVWNRVVFESTHRGTFINIFIVSIPN